MSIKIIPHKNYGSIGHLPESRLGSGDHYISQGQADRLTKIPQKDIHIIVTEKLDGSNVGVIKLNSEIIPLTRAGYRANTSRYEQHHLFEKFVAKNYNRFNELLKEGERICGEWLVQTHGIRYRLTKEPFAPFDIFTADNHRIIYEEFIYRIKNFNPPALLSIGVPYSVEQAINALGESGFHGAIDKPEGAVWRAERKGKVEFLAKYIRHDKIDGEYMKNDTWNEGYEKWI